MIKSRKMPASTAAMLISNLACLAVAVFTAVFLCGSYETAYNPIPYREISHRRDAENAEII